MKYLSKNALKGFVVSGSGVRRHPTRIASILVNVIFFLGIIAVVFAPVPAAAQTASLCSSGISPTTNINSRKRSLSHPEFDAKGWRVKLRTGPSMDCESERIMADNNLQVTELGTIITDQSWSLLEFTQDGITQTRWAETKFLNEPNGAGPAGPPTPISPLPSGIPIVIYDTDMGPDIDDALGLAALHAYANQGMAHIAAVTLSRNSDTGARYIDLLNTFYARPDIPIGVYRGTTEKDTAEGGYTQDIVNSGKYAHSLDIKNVPQGHLLMRDVLREAPDNSVVIIQVGFSTNTARLLEEYPDLVAQKIRLLSVTAGNFAMPSGAAKPAEFNIKIHPSSARTVFSRWPNEVVVSEVNLGENVFYPLRSIQDDFNYVTNHPIKDSYLNSTYSWHRENGESYDMKTWDITAVVAAIQPSVIPKVLGPGKVTVSNSNETSFKSGGGAHYVLAEGAQLSRAQHQELVELMIQLVSAQPVDEQPSAQNFSDDPTPTPSATSNPVPAVSNASVSCSGWVQPADGQGVSTFNATVLQSTDARRGPSAHSSCDRGFDYESGTSVQVTARLGEYSYVSNTSSDDWAWVLTNSFTVSTAPAPSPSSTSAPSAPIPPNPALSTPSPSSSGSDVVVDSYIALADVATDNTLNVRAGPGTNFTIISKFQRNTTMRVTHHSGVWRRIFRAGGQAAYVHGNYIRKSPTPSKRPTTQAPTAQTSVATPARPPTTIQCQTITLDSYEVTNGMSPFNDKFRTDVMVRGFVKMKKGDTWFMRGTTDSASKAIEIKPKMRAFTGAQEIYLTKDGGYEPLDFDPLREDLFSFVAGGDGRGAPRTPICEYRLNPRAMPHLPFPTDCHFGKNYQSSKLSDAESKRFAKDLELIYCPVGAQQPANRSRYQQCGRHDGISAHGKKSCWTVQ